MRKVLFFGLGSIGRRHAKNMRIIEPDCDILAYRVRSENYEDFEKDYNVRSFSNLFEALAQKPSIAFITNPTRFHVSAALEAAKTGCDLFIEKPISDTLDQVDDLMALCQSSGCLAMTAYKMRFHWAVLKVKEILDRGILGKIFFLRAHYGGYLPDWHPWEDYRRMYSARKDLGGGIVLDATHEIDTLFWLGGDVADIKSFSGKIGPLEMDTEDTAQISLRFKTGAYGSIFLTYLQRPESRALEVIGENGTVLWNESRQKVEYFDAKSREWHSYLQPERYDPNHMFLDELRYFLDCVDKRKQPHPDLREARRVLEIALAIKSEAHSSQGGRV